MTIENLPGGDGLSPRGRGNRGRSDPGAGRRRSIPAWAGKPEASAPPERRPKVYPRVGGETGAIEDTNDARYGLSPRGRGNLRCATLTSTMTGSIPAWAGKPWRPCRRSPHARVYPRVGGETRGHQRFLRPYRGLSPRGRGNPTALRRAGPPYGSIPAWAGKPGVSTRTDRSVTVYPRVGGETVRVGATLMVRQGLSPRGRGNPWQ